MQTMTLSKYVYDCLIYLLFLSYDWFIARRHLWEYLPLRPSCHYQSVVVQADDNLRSKVIAKAWVKDEFGKNNLSLWVYVSDYSGGSSEGDQGESLGESQ